MIKEFNISNIKMYWNSMSEIFIPTSLWEQTRNNPDLQLFEAMDASFLRDVLMHDAFNEKPSMVYNYLLQPFNVRTSINYKKSYEATDGYRYQINTLVSTISLNVSPQMCRDILKF